jgi:hypothetical protein
MAILVQYLMILINMILYPTNLASIGIIWCHQYIKYYFQKILPWCLDWVRHLAAGCQYSTSIITALSQNSTDVWYHENTDCGSFEKKLQYLKKQWQKHLSHQNIGTNKIPNILTIKFDPSMSIVFGAEANVTK